MSFHVDLVNRRSHFYICVCECVCPERWAVCPLAGLSGSHVFSTTCRSAFINHNSPNYPPNDDCDNGNDRWFQSLRNAGEETEEDRRTEARKCTNVSYKEKKAQLRWLLEDTGKIVPLCQDWPPMNEESVPVEQVIEDWVWDYRLCVCVCFRAQITSELLRVHPGGGFCSCFYISYEI